MSTIVDLEKEILALSPTEREQLATIAWESLISDPTAAGNREIDPDGIRLAAERDAEIEAGTTKPIDHAEFRRRTGGTSE